jgi:large subunit ribosomal protein L15
MSELSNLEAPEGANKRRRRIGRGESSGWGKTAGMGGKGQKGRQGGGKPGHGFEGGQMPLQRRLPKRGFRSENRVEYAVINLRDLGDFEAGAVIDPDLLRSRGLVKKGHDLLKVLGDGELSVALTIRAHQFSKSAIEKINGAGGSVELIER